MLSLLSSVDVMDAVGREEAANIFGGRVEISDNSIGDTRIRDIQDELTTAYENIESCKMRGIFFSDDDTYWKAWVEKNEGADEEEDKEDEIMYEQLQETNTEEEKETGELLKVNIVGNVNSLVEDIEEETRTGINRNKMIQMTKVKLDRMIENFLVKKSYRNERIWLCKLCHQENLKTKCNGQAHVETHLMLQIYCDHCNTICKTTDNFVQHMKMKHKTEAIHTKVLCPYNILIVLFNQTKGLSKIRSYMKEGTNEEAYVCPVCNLEDPIRKRINIHMKKHHKYIKSIKQTSPPSGKEINREVNSYLSIHTNENGRLYFSCDLCLKENSRKPLMKVHIELHLNFIHPCPFCWEVKKTRHRLCNHKHQRHFKKFK